jgi:hypothetical protein
LFSIPSISFCLFYFSVAPDLAVHWLVQLRALNGSTFHFEREARRREKKKRKKAIDPHRGKFLSASDHIHLIGLQPCNHAIPRRSLSERSSGPQIDSMSVKISAKDGGKRPQTGDMLDTQWMRWIATRVGPAGSLHVVGCLLAARDDIPFFSNLISASIDCAV